MSFTFQAILKKKDGKLEYSVKANSKIYQEFLKNIKEGQEVEIYMEILSEQPSKAQLRKINTMIRILAESTGNDFEDMKDLVKERAGVNTGSSIRSFSKDCSKEEITLAIEACRKLGEELNIILE
jgi:hypothetical protein